MSDSTDIIPFVSDRNLTAQQNLDNMIKHTKSELDKIFPGKNWDDDKWPKSNGSIGSIKWTTLEAAGRHNKITPLQQPFCDFAKVYVVITQSDNFILNQTNKLQSLRCLEKAQLEIQNKADVINITAEVFNRAVSIAKERFKSPYMNANKLSHIKDFLNENHVTNAHISWSHSEKPDMRSVAIGEEGKEYERKKLPPPEIFPNLPYLIDVAFKPNAAAYDTIPIYTLMLLACSPARIGEACYQLPVDCLDTHNKNIFLRWFPEKGAPPLLKKIAPKMMGHAVDIIAGLKKHTDEGRKIARWYEKNPTSLYLPDHIAHLREKEFVSTKEAMHITGKTTKHSLFYLMNTIKIKSVAKENTPGRYSFVEIEKKLLEKTPLPESFPYVDPLHNENQLKFSDALYTAPKNAISYRATTVPYMFEIIKDSQIRQKFTSKAETTNIFSRHGITTADGRAIHLNSSSIRHLLDALKQHMGVDEKTRAREAGRKDIHHNHDYNKLTEKDFDEKAKELGIIANIEKNWKPNSPVKFEEFLKMNFPNVHLTEYGFCAHDWAQSLCPKYGDHILCTDHYYVKGAMPEKEQMLRKLQIELEPLVEDSYELNEDGMLVLDRWGENKEELLKVLDKIIEILDDPKIKPGLVFSLTPNREINIHTQMIDQRLQLNHKDDQQLMETVKEIREQKAIEDKEKEAKKEKYKPELLAPYLEMIDEDNL